MLKKILLFIISWTWCLPQQMTGLIVRFITNAKKTPDGYYTYGLNYSASFGSYIFISNFDLYNERVIKHEKGHTIQSYIFGWFWIFIFGIPSLIWNSCFRKYRKKHNIDYYSFYTERFADKLGNV